MIDQFCQSYPIAGSSVLISSLKVTVIAFPRFCPQVGATGDIRSAKPINTASPIHLCLICSPPVRFPISTNPITLCPSPPGEGYTVGRIRAPTCRALTYTSTSAKICESNPLTLCPSPSREMGIWLSPTGFSLTPALQRRYVSLTPHPLSLSLQGEGNVVGRYRRPPYP